MSHKNIPELSFLLSEVEKKYGRRVATSTDFETLSVVIEMETGDLISSSTLKRLWGYVSLNPTPRIATLDVLSRFIGKRGFKDFCEGLKDSHAFVSTFFSSRCLDIASLQPGQKVTLGWAPNRIVVLDYLGDFNFEVVSNENSHLLPGDRFELSNVILEYPLVISKILRNGEYTPSYIAGQQGGINLMKVD